MLRPPSPSRSEVLCLAPISDLFGYRVEGVDAPLVNGKVDRRDDHTDVVERVALSRLNAVQADTKGIVRILAARVIGRREWHARNLARPARIGYSLKDRRYRQIEGKRLALGSLLCVTNSRSNGGLNGHQLGVWQASLSLARRHGHRKLSRRPLDLETRMTRHGREARPAAPRIAICAPFALHDVRLLRYLFSVHLVLHPPTRIVLLSTGYFGNDWDELKAQAIDFVEKWLASQAERAGSIPATRSTFQHNGLRVIQASHLRRGFTGSFTPSVAERF